MLFSQFDMSICTAWIVWLMVQKWPAYVSVCAFTPPHMVLNEVAVCFGGKLMHGNRAQKVNSSNYQVLMQHFR
jgi:hypothetical protein